MVNFLEHSFDPWLQGMYNVAVSMTPLNQCKRRCPINCDLFENRWVLPVAFFFFFFFFFFFLFFFFFFWGGGWGELRATISKNVPYASCADPESFVRGEGGGPTQL